MNGLLDFFIILPLLLALFKFAPGAGVCQLEGMVPGIFVVKEENIFHEKSFHLRIKEIGKGGYGKVYHAHLENWAEFVSDAAVESAAEQQPHCVALKVAGKDAGTATQKENALLNEIEILRAFAKLETQIHHRHLVKLYHEGRLVPNGQIDPVGEHGFIMELGGMSLSDCLYDKAEQCINAGIKIKIKDMAKDIALAMSDFHRVAMHLDLKPGNMVYFPKSNWANANAKILKPIDFGSSQILDPNDVPKNRANSSKDDVVLPVGTPHYSAPELKYDTGVVLTPKADIWSIGIMIYEAILCNLHATDLDFFYDLMGEKVHPTHMIGELNNLYKYNKDQWIDERKRPQGTTNVDDLRNIDEQHLERRRVEYAAYVFLVFKIRANSTHRVLYELANSCLEFKPEHRPSASGILEYLKGECNLNLVNAESPILLDQETVEIIEKRLKKIKSKLRYQTKRLLLKLPFTYTKEKEKLKLQLAEISRIMGFLKFNGRDLNLRKPMMNKVDNLPVHHNRNVSKWCDTKTSQLPKFKVAEGPSTSETVHHKGGISEIQEEKHEVSN